MIDLFHFHAHYHSPDTDTPKWNVAALMLLGAHETTVIKACRLDLTFYPNVLYEEGIQ